MRLEIDKGAAWQFHKGRTTENKHNGPYMFVSIDCFTLIVGLVRCPYSYSAFEKETVAWKKKSIDIIISS